MATALPAVADSSIFAPLTLTQAPSATRLANGAPGPKYWQNRADYVLHVTLDTATGTVRGTITLRYTNNSPDTLPVVWIQTWQDQFDRFTETVGGKPVAVQLADHRTGEMKVTLPQPIKPGGTATFDAAWHLIAPSPNPSDPKLGLLTPSLGVRDGSLYLLVDCHPRVHVYDDVRGWDIAPDWGTATESFEFGDYTILVTVPADYVVAATGTLDNPQDVLTPAERTRLAQAAHADTVVHIITAEELRTGAAHLKHDGMVTWRFHAKEVQDAAVSLSPQYQWDATSWKGILAQAYYRPRAANGWRHVADIARKSIQEYSERWYPYPYPQVSIATGPSFGGIAYPMLSFVGTGEGDSGGQEIGWSHTWTHEVGHNWFQLLVGANERTHSWMSEGFNTFINSFSDARYDPHHAVRVHDVYTGQWKPGIHNEYDGTAYVLDVLRRDILGPAVFDSAFRTYIRRWAYKHPTPQDFFRTMDDVAGRDLAWFWRESFLEPARFDQAIDSVSQTTQGSETHVTVTYGNKGRAVMPLLVRFTFSDGTTQSVTSPADVWRANSTQYVVAYTFKKTVRRIELDPDTHLPDADLANNVWTAK